MKELILITSYTPDNKRENLLRNLVNGVKGTGYDIMVVSHTSIPKDIIDNVNYFIYDSKNFLLYEIKDKVIMNFDCENFTIYTTETKKYNHCYSFIRLLKLGLINAKKLNYKKVHFFEYDSLIENFFEINDNSGLIENIGTVFYQPSGLQWPNSPMSFNLDKISEEWFVISDEGYFEFTSNRYSKTSEEYQMFLIDKCGGYIKKNDLDLNKNGIKCGLNIDQEEVPWAVVVCDEIDDEMFFFGWNQNQYDIDIKIIVNNLEVFHKKVIPGFWNLSNVGNLDKIEHIVILVNNEVKNVLNLNKIGKENFKKRNFLRKK